MKSGCQCVAYIACMHIRVLLLDLTAGVGAVWYDERFAVQYTSDMHAQAEMCVLSCSTSGLPYTRKHGGLPCGSAYMKHWCMPSGQYMQAASYIRLHVTCWIKPAVLLLDQRHSRVKQTCRNSLVPGHGPDHWVRNPPLWKFGFS